MNLFLAHNRPKKDDSCGCGHKFIDHDINTSFCVVKNPRCPCMYFVRRTKRNAKWRPEDVSELNSEVRRKVDSPESQPTGGQDGNEEMVQIKDDLE